MRDSTTRFSNRVENYVKWRPLYPPAVVDELRDVCGLTPDWTIADIGSGPGNLSRLFLDFGATVIGVEPNKEMREAGGELLKAYPRFRDIDGTAERTGLSTDSVDLVTAGQAFHWFDPAEARREFRRILKEPKWVALIWNDRVLDRTPFSRRTSNCCEPTRRTILRWRTKACASDRGDRGVFRAESDAANRFAIRAGFRRGGVCAAGLNPRRTRPAAGEPGYTEMIAETDRIFAEHQTHGVVHFLYDTRIYVGRLNK